jgi:hypothetical protein
MKIPLPPKIHCLPANYENAISGTSRLHDTAEEFGMANLATLDRCDCRSYAVFVKGLI